MKSTVTAMLVLLGALAAAPAARAHGEAVLGAGAVIGQAFGGREGRIVGGAIGAVTGTAISTGHSRTWNTQPVHFYPPAQGYYNPPARAYHPPSRAYYPPPRAYFPPPSEYYPASGYVPAPVYPPPAVIWRGHPGHDHGYGRAHDYGYGYREWR